MEVQGGLCTSRLPRPALVPERLHAPRSPARPLTGALAEGEVALAIRIEVGHVLHNSHARHLQGGGTYSEVLR